MDIDFEDGRILEMEQNSIELHIDGMILHIPDNVLKERMELLCFDTVEEALKDIEILSSAFCKNLANRHIIVSNIEEEVLKYLDFELEPYRRSK